LSANLFSVTECLLSITSAIAITALAVLIIYTVEATATSFRLHCLMEFENRHFTGTFAMQTITHSQVVGHRATLV
jgi:hypothetical protein